MGSNRGLDLIHHKLQVVRLTPLGDSAVGVELEHSLDSRGEGAAADAGVTDLLHHDDSVVAKQRLHLHRHAADRSELGCELGRNRVCGTTNSSRSVDPYGVVTKKASELVRLRFCSSG